MAWNPSPEVAVARDAAAKLGAIQCVVVWTTKDGQLGMASYGQTMTLCAETKKLGNHLYDEALRYFEADELIAPAAGGGERGE